MKFFGDDVTASDIRDLSFRLLFSLIFFGLGAEHVSQSTLLKTLMPDWVPFKDFVSAACGLWLLGWGSFVLVGYKIRVASVALGAFVIGVTLLVHLPGVLVTPERIASSCESLWQILQRSNLGKNVCLVGMCLMLFDYQPGLLSFEGWNRIRRKREP